MSSARTAGQARRRYCATQPHATPETCARFGGRSYSQEHHHDRATGVGKTEIARRLAKLANSPFLKVEASKFTEVGYVGRDVESMIRDLVDIAIDMVREEKARGRCRQSRTQR